ncbi:MAG: hypothetical protein LBM16_01115 [Clostridiales bacterium]|jgi:hypothetical protein|nr:hypothetical protein [Clostridiales bacterium]
MIKHIVELIVPNATSEQFYDFMINPIDHQYRQWWDGEHLSFHIVKSGKENHLGDIVFMDEHIGANRRLTFFAVVTGANRPNQIVWQMKKFGLRLPAYVELNLTDLDNGILLKHELRIGFLGIGKLLDPIFRIYFNRSFQKSLKEHCEIEWYRLAEYLKN